MLTENLDSLLSPINTQHHVGVDVRSLSETAEGFIKYSLLKDTRNNLRREERKNIEIEHNLLIESQYWHEVKDLACKLLLLHTKDIEISCWFVESLVRIDKFAGLKIGFDILSGLIEQYGNALYPATDLDDEDIEDKLASVAMLSGKYEIGTLVIPMYYHTIIPTYSGSNLNAWVIRKYLENSNATEGDVRLSVLEGCNEIQNAISEVIREEFDQNVSDLAACKVSFNKFNSLLSLTFGRNAPNLSNLEKVMHYCCSIVNNVAEILEKRSIARQNNKEKEEKSVIQDANLSLKSMNQEGAMPLHNWSFTSLSAEQLVRQDAIQMLEILVQFFRTADPHSPISYSLERILRWSRLSLPEIVEEMVNDQAKEEYSKITGVPLLQKSTSINKVNQKNYDDS